MAAASSLDALNNRLAAAKAYDKLTQKRILAWAEIRNNAVHGYFNAYTESDVDEMEAWVAKFRTKWSTAGR